MKALVARELSGPAGLEYTDVEDAVGGGDQDSVVVDVGATGVSFPDLLLLRGEYQMRLEPPFIPGMEVAGVVRSAPYESEFKPGQRVTALSMLGGWAEQVVVSPNNLTPTPDDLDDAEAVALLGNYQTMYFALAKRGALRSGETVLVLGSASGRRPSRSQRLLAPR
jgi:NADPH:quinone reductase